MTKTLAVDANNDLFVTAAGVLAVAEGIAASAYACTNAAKAIRGEMVLAVDEGMPYFEVVWSGAPNIAQFEAALRSRLLAVDGVTDITDLETRRTGDTLAYTATLQTSFGAVTING